MAVSGTFSAAGASDEAKLDAHGRGSVQIIGTNFVGQVDLQRKDASGNWGNTGDSLTSDGVLHINDMPYTAVRLNCSVLTGGSAAYTLQAYG